jgi:serine/threonine protein phosphatase PrpC
VPSAGLRASALASTKSAPRCRCRAAPRGLASDSAPSAALPPHRGATWRRLTEDHRIAANPAEQARLAARSGHAVHTRLYGLNLSRMLGDRFLKEAGLGFTARPHVGARVALPPGGDAAVVVASDGLWDVVNGERAAHLVARALAGDGGGREGQAGAGGTAAAAAEALMHHALQQRSRDDVSVMVLRIRPPLGGNSGSGGDSSRAATR